MYALRRLTVLNGKTSLGMKRAERRRRKKVKAASLSDGAHHHHHHRARDVELATLRQLPTSNNFVTENNVLYNLNAFPGLLKGFLSFTVLWNSHGN